MLIRRATAKDAPALTACIAAAYAPFFQAGLSLPPVAEGIVDDIRDHHVLVAEDRRQIVGGVVVVLGETAHLANLAVHPDAAGQGIGGALVAHAVRAAKDAGFDQIHLATHSQMTATQAFYRQLGWVEVGREGDKVYFDLQL